MISAKIKISLPRPPISQIDDVAEDDERNATPDPQTGDHQAESEAHLNGP
jgi:hypothetical protein